MKENPLLNEGGGVSYTLRRFSMRIPMPMFWS